MSEAKPERVESLLARGDAIGALCLVVKEAGLTMTLHGVPIRDAHELRFKALEAATERLAMKMARIDLLSVLSRHG